MYVCVSLYILRIVYCYHYSECQESPITQETNGTARCSTSVRIQKMSENSMPNVTGPAKRDQVGTKYIISQNGTYLEFCVQYLFSVSCRTLPMQLLIDG